MRRWELTVHGPRPSDEVWLIGSEDGEDGRVNGCTGEGKYPQGEAEVEGTLKEGVFVLSKPPKYVKSAAPAPSESAK